MLDSLRKKTKKSDAEPENKEVDVSHLSDAKQQLFAQLRAKREELGPEEIAKMQKAVKMEAMKRRSKPILKMTKINAIVYLMKFAFNETNSSYNIKLR